MKARIRFVDSPSVCMYLPDRQAMTEFEVVARITAEEYERRMDQGWRKFGRILFHPVCAGCRECRPIRIPLDRFKPDRSQRRALKRNADLTVRIDVPKVNGERMDLWNRYHAAQSKLKGWPYEPSTPWLYSMTYVHNPIPSLELSVFEGDRLAGVCLLDVTPNTLSGIYHYHDPDLADRSLGKYLMLKSIDAARDLGKSYFYLGYYVAGCPSMSYKSAFRPCELMDERGNWAEFA